MSASIYWRPTGPRGTSLGVSAPQAFLAIMRELFYGEPPWTLDDSNILELRGAAAASCMGVREGFEELIDAIEKHRSVRVEVEY